MSFRLAVLLAATATSLALGQATPQGSAWPPFKAGKPVYTKVTGLRLSFETLWFTPGGYRPVTVRVEAAKASPDDREIEIEIESGDLGDPEAPLIRSRQSVTLLAGETQAEAVVLAPSLNETRQFRWSVSVDGTTDPELQSDDAGLVWPMVATANSMRAFAPWSPIDTARFVVDVRGGNRNYLGTIRNLVAEDLDGWVAYSAGDFAVVTLGQLRDAAKTNDGKLRTLRHWLLAGGTVWIEGAGDDADRLGEIDSLLGIDRWRFRAVESERDPEPIPQAPTEIENDSEEIVEDKPEKKRRIVRPIADAPGWGHVVLADDSRLLKGAEQLGGKAFSGALEALTGPSRDSRGWFAQRGAGFGRVLAFTRTASAPPDRLRFGQAESIRSTWRERGWVERHGIALGGKSPQFGNLLIPGVGVAPINEFQILITLFVLIIGPLNYWLLWRRQQLQLLVITVPLCAVAATLGLASYAALSDGFGVKARVRSVTLLDQATGEAASWSRVTHYVATAPADRPVMPADCAVYPIEPAWETAIASTGKRRAVTWTDRGQELTSGWIPSRTAVQHLLVRCRESPARLEIQASEEQVSAANKLGAPVELLVVRDAEGGWWLGEGLGVDEQARLTSTDRFEGLKAYRTLAIANEPEFPIGAGKAVEDALERLGAGRDVRRMQRQFADVNLVDGLGERMLSSISGLDGGRSLDLAPSTYVAITSQAVETPLGWSDVQEVGSFHVVMGRW